MQTPLIGRLLTRLLGRIKNRPLVHTRQHSMLKQRVITAIALLSVLVPALLSSSQVPLALVSLILCATGAWEWGRLNDLSFQKASGIALFCTLLCAGSWRFRIFIEPNYYFWLTCSVLWVFVGAILLRLGPDRWLNINKTIRILGGVFALYATWIAIFQAKAMSVNFLLSIFALVWVADIGAYFFGRAFGRRKLAINISPGKSWEGVWGGVLAVLFLSWVWVWFDSVQMGQIQPVQLNSQNSTQANYLSLFSLLADKGFVTEVIALIFMFCMSVVGDLIESLVKRSSGAKDSSKLLPGHGGVLDRIDALLPTLPIAMLWSLI